MILTRGFGRMLRSDNIRPPVTNFMYVQGGKMQARKALSCAHLF